MAFVRKHYNIYERQSIVYKGQFKTKSRQNYFVETIVIEFIFSFQYSKESPLYSSKLGNFKLRNSKNEEVIKSKQFSF